MARKRNQYLNKCPKCNSDKLHDLTSDDVNYIHYECLHCGDEYTAPRYKPGFGGDDGCSKATLVADTWRDNQFW